MNFEQSCRLIAKNPEKIKNKTACLRLLRYQKDAMLLNRRRLKLGSVSFVVKEYKFDEFILFEDLEIRYIRQDNTLEDERKIETLLKKMGWEWNYKNYVALAVVIYFAITRSINSIYLAYCHHFPALAIRPDHYNYVIKCGFQTAYSYHSITFFRQLSRKNFWLIDVLTEFCAHYSIIF